jgi:hypothetical protein
MLKPEPLALAAEMVRLEPPVLVSVSERLELLPICTFPKARLVRFGVSVPCDVPVPDSGRFKVESEPLELKATFPLKVPADCGANVTEKEALCPAPNVSGTTMPFTMKLAPERVT